MTQWLTSAISVFSILFAVTSSHAALTFSVDSFTTDELVITLYGGQTLDGPTPANVGILVVADHSGLNTSWLSSNIGASASNAQMVGAQAIFTSIAYDDVVFGDNVRLNLGGAPNPGDMTNVSATYTFSQVGALNPAAVDIANLGLQWGATTGPTTGGTFQSFAILAPGVVPELSVVPEPSTYIAAVGFFGLGVFVICRRRKNVAETASVEE